MTRTELDHVDLLFDFQAFQTVEFWLVTLKLRVELVFDGFEALGGFPKFEFGGGGR